MTRARDLADFNLDGKAVTINESSADLDFRVESDNAVNAFFVQGSSGNVGINNASPSNKLHVHGAAEFNAHDNTSGSGGYNASGLLIGNAHDAGKGSSVTDDRNSIIWNERGLDIDFGTTNTYRMKLTHDGNLLVGKTSASVTTVGAELRPDGAIIGVRNGDLVALLNRTSSDGEIISLRKDGSTAGTIGTITSSGAPRLYIGNDDTSVLFHGGADNITPANGSGGTRDNAIDIGSSSARFKDLYLGGNLYLGGTGSANALDDYEEGDWTPTGNGITITNNFAKYRKIGTLVAVQAFVVFPTNSDTSNNANISGLPFAGTQPSNAYGALSVGYSDQGSSFTILKGNANSDIDLRLHNGNNLKNADLSGKTVIFAGVYISV